MPVPQQSNSERIAGILSRARQAPPQRPDPFSGIAPRPAWEGAAGLPQPGARPPPASDPWAEGLRWGREEEGFPADSDNAPLDRSALARLQGETAEQDYSPLGPEWGWLDPLAGLATAGVKAGADSLMQPFDEGARDRTQQRREYLQGAGIGALDFDLGNSGDQDWNAQSDFWADREGAENFGDWVLGRPGQERRADMRQTQSDLDARSQGVAVLPDVVVEGTDVGIGRSVGAAASDFWRGPSEAARASRRDAVTGFAMEDALREAGDEEGAAAYQRQARRSAAADSFITGAGALELAPGMGLVDTALGAGRFGARQIIRGVAGREAEIPAHLTPRDWSPTEAFAGRPDEAMHDPGLLTRASERWRLPTAVTAVGAVAADQAMDGDFGDPLQLAGGAAITAGALRAAPRLIEGAGDIAGRALGRGEDPLADIAPRVADDAPRSFEGAPRQTGDVIDAEAAPVQSERRTINLPQPFAGAADVTVNPSREELAAMIARQPEGESVKWGVDSNGDLLAWENGQAVSHGMVTGQPSREGGGFQVHGTLEDPLEIDVALLTASRMRNEGPTRYSADDFANELGISPETAQTMLERDGRLGWPAYGDRETVGVGEQVNRDGRVTPRDPINWDAPQTRLPADDEWFANLSGTQAPTRMNIVSEGGVPGRSADDMLRSAPDGGRAREGFDTDRVVYRGLGRPYDAADGGYYQSFTSSLDDAQEYGSNVIAAHIRPGRNLAIDGGGNNFNSLSVQQLPADVRARLHPGVGDAATTDQIAHAAREAGYDSVTVRNVHDNRWGERPGRNTEARTIDFVFDTKNISPLDNVPTQPPRAEAAAERVRLSEADRALLAELEDFPGSTLPPLRAHEGSWIGTSQTGEVREFFNQANAQKALDAGWTVRTAGDHLANLNRNGPNAGSAQTGQRAYEAQLQADGFDVSAPLYHGTGRNFDEFALGQPETTFGADNSSAIYLTSKPHIADAYAGSIDDNLLAHRQNIDPDWAPHVRQVYVRDSNPLVLSDRDYSWLKQGDAVRTGRARDRYSVDRGQRAWESIFPGEAPPAEGTYFEALRQRGFTSVRMESGDEIAVFDPANIRPRFGPTRAQPNAGPRRLGDAVRTDAIPEDMPPLIARNPEADDALSRFRENEDEFRRALDNGPPEGNSAMPRARRLGQDPVSELNDAGAQSANGARTEADISREWPTDPEQWREVMGTHPWINSPSRAQMVLMMSARDESGRFLYNAEQIAAAAHLASPESMNVLANRAREAGVPIPPRPKGGGGATRMPGGDRLNRAVEVLESAVRSGEPMTWSTLDRRMGIADGSSRSWLATALNNPAVPQKLKDRIRAAINANPRTLGPRRNDPLDAIAPIGIGAGAAALAFGDDAEAQDAEVLSDGRMIDPDMPDLDFSEGQWQGEWSRTNLSDGSEALMRVIEGPDGQPYTIIGVQNRSGEIDFLGTVQPTEGPPEPYNPVGDVYEHAYDNVLSEPYEPPPRERGQQPDWIRPMLAAGAGLAARGLVGRGAGRVTQDFATGITAAGADVALGGDWTEGIPLGTLLPLGARGAEWAVEQGARRAGTTARDGTLLADPSFRAERDAFAQTLPDEAPRVRTIRTENYHGDVLREAEGRAPISIGDEEAITEGFARDLPSESIGSQRQQFLDAHPEQQRQWMDEASRGRGPDTGQIGFASGIDESVRAALAAPGAGVPRNEIPADVRIGGTRPVADGNEVTAQIANADEMVTTSYGANLQARRGQDYILTEPNGDRRVVRRDVFERTYEPTSNGNYRKSPNQIVGYWVTPDARTIQTLEGPVQANAGDYVMVGSVGEMWPVRPEQFARKYQTSGPADPRALDDIAPPMTPDEVGPMPRQFRATPEDIMENPDRGTLASPARHAQSLATIADEYGVEVARGARGGVNAKRTAANLARAARDNPALQAELRRRGLWAAVLTGGAAAAGTAGEDPLAGVSTN